MSLKDPLLPKDGHADHFGLNPEQLTNLFVKENRTDDDGNVSKSRTFVKKLGDAQGIYKALDSRESYGIDMDSKKIEERKHHFGENARRKFKQTTICEMIGDILEDKILRILLLAAFVSLVIGVWQEGIEKGWIEGMSIYIAICIIMVVTVSNNYSKEKQFRKLMEAREDKHCVVIRKGEHEQISIYNLLVGDIVQINEGDSIPADLILLTGVKISTDESNITGEPEHMNKISLEEDTKPHGESDCFLLAKSTVMSGKGLGIVCAVGMHTQQGQAESKLNIDAEQTPLQEKLEKIADLIGWIGIYASILTFLASISNMVVHKLLNDQSLWEFSTINKIMDSVILSITIVVVAVPEGLPLAVTISLAYSVMKMKEDNNLVRRLDASETMGGADQICSDKTGTLTQNKMSVVSIYIEDRIEKNIDHCSKNTKDNFFLNVGFNSTAQLLVDEKDPKKTIRQGNQTE